jgi:hypothetical protein
MSRTFKKQPKRERPKRIKENDGKKPILKRTNFYNFAEDELEE